jgi:hypothetical protein
LNLLYCRCKKAFEINSKHGVSKMIKNLSKTLFLLCLLLSVTSQALPILQADAFTEGDNKAAVEIDTGLIWMDFGVNTGSTYSEIVNSLSTDYVGWRLPTLEEVDHLWMGLFGNLPEYHRWEPELGVMYSMDYDDYFGEIFSVFGTTEDLSSIYLDENGVISDTWISKTMQGVFQVSPEIHGMVRAQSPYDDVHPNDTLYLVSSNINVSDWITSSTLLVKDPVTVPEPGALSLLLLGLFGIVIIKRIRKI